MTVGELLKYLKRVPKDTVVWVNGVKADKVIVNRYKDQISVLIQ